MTELLLKEEVYQVVGAAMEVHNVLGPGFLEGVYQEAFEYELQERNIPFAAQCPLQVRYKERTLTHEYIADAVAFDAVVVELKAMDSLPARRTRNSLTT